MREQPVALVYQSRLGRPLRIAPSTDSDHNKDLVLTTLTVLNRGQSEVSSLLLKTNFRINARANRHIGSPEVNILARL